MKAEPGGRMAAAIEPLVNSQSVRLEELFWEHHDRVLRAAYRITGNMADAEDVTQTVFIRLAGATEQIANVESYLYRAAINGALDVVRRRKRETELEPAFEIASSSPMGEPDRQLSSGELRGWLRSALAKLTPSSAELFILRYVEELDNGEVAKLVGSSRAVIAVRLHQIRARLKKDYEQYLRGGK